MLNGKLLNDKITAKEGRLQSMLTDEASTDSIVASFYWRALSRAPRPEESAFWRGEIDRAGSRSAALEDFVWSLLGSAAFSQNH